MPNKIARTYRLEKKTVDWVEEFADENDADYTEVVERAIRVYAAKVSSGDWKDPRFQSVIDEKFDQMR